MVNQDNFHDGSGLFQENNTLMLWSLGVSEWFDKLENDVNHMLWPSQPSGLNQAVVRRLVQPMSGVFKMYFLSPINAIVLTLEIQPL